MKDYLETIKNLISSMENIVNLYDKIDKIKSKVTEEEFYEEINKNKKEFEELEYKYDKLQSKIIKRI